MRFIFVNLHCNSALVSTITHTLMKRKTKPKHAFIIKYLCGNGFRVANYIDERGSSFCQYNIIKNSRILSAVFSKFGYAEHKKVMKYNGLDESKIEVLTSPEEISDSDIVIFYLNREANISCEISKGKKICMLLHFYGTLQESELLRVINPCACFAESRLPEFSPMWKKNFMWYQGDFYLLPFVPTQRFCSKKAFCTRRNKAMAVGTITTFENEEFEQVIGTQCFQPLRLQIYENRMELSEYLDSYQGIFNEKGKKDLLPQDNIVVKLYKKIFNFINIGNQKQYFSFDMVEKFNEYKLFLCPEDAHYNPGVGFVEGMACGTAFIGLNNGIYESFGMKDGRDYIGYDGSLKDLKQKIEYWTADEKSKELEEIANSGMKFIRTQFNPIKVVQSYIDICKKIVGSTDIS